MKLVMLDFRVALFINQANNRNLKNETDLYNWNYSLDYNVLAWIKQFYPFQFTYLSSVNNKLIPKCILIEHSLYR